MKKLAIVFALLSLGLATIQDAYSDDTAFCNMRRRECANRNGQNQQRTASCMSNIPRCANHN